MRELVISTTELNRVAQAVHNAMRHAPKDSDEARELSSAYDKLMLMMDQHTAAGIGRHESTVWEFTSIRRKA